MGDTTAAVASLVDAGLLTRHPATAADRVLGLLTRQELIQQFPFSAAQLGRAVRRVELEAAILATNTDRRLRAQLATYITWLQLNGGRSLERLLLLCFGTTRQDLSAFVLRDLGMQRYETYPLGHAGGFADAATVDRHLAISALEDWLPRLPHITGLHVALLGRLSQADEFRPTERRRSRLLNELGRWHERRGDPDRALACYGISRRHPARERCVRLLRRRNCAGDLAAADALLEAMQAAPWCAEEQTFASRQGGKGRRQTAPATACLPMSDPGLEFTAGAVERMALRELAAGGAWGIHVENALPLGLTALAYWDVLFAPVAGAFTNLMQNGPHDLFQEDFAHVRRSVIDLCRRRLRMLDDPGALLLRRLEAKSGIACALCNWRVLSPEAVGRIVAAMPRSHLLDLVDTVIEAPYRWRTGFPDLFVVHASGGYEFIEVKGPADQLQPQQRAWFDRLHRLGLHASVRRYHA
ncbi:MAG: VRR-NUC domain-containing protein [Pseudomonadales bacterium]